MVAENENKILFTVQHVQGAENNIKFNEADMTDREHADAMAAVYRVFCGEGGSLMLQNESARLLRRYHPEIKISQGEEI